MAIKYRGEYLSPTDEVTLAINIKDSNGQPIDADSFPQISIVSPTGLVILTPTSQGMAKASTGTYNYTFAIPISGPYGVFMDIWVFYVNGVRYERTLQFIVANTQFAGINIDGYEHLGEDIGFEYSQEAIHNVNKLLKMMRARLNSSGKSLIKDANGNDMYVDCDIFSVDMLVTFLGTALEDFNQTPYFTYFNYDDSAFVNQFGAILVEIASYYAMASLALIERGREYNIQDNSLSFQPPTVSELLNTQYSALLTHCFEKLRYIKNSLRPLPLGLGVFTMSGYSNPAVRRLRHLRERQII